MPADVGTTGDVEIVTATTPTELIWSDGPPQMSTLQGTGLLYWANTASDVFLMIDSQQMYVLLSGRWYTSPNKNGPWTFVAPDKSAGQIFAHSVGQPQELSVGVGVRHDGSSGCGCRCKSATDGGG